MQLANFVAIVLFVCLNFHPFLYRGYKRGLVNVGEYTVFALGMKVSWRDGSVSVSNYDLPQTIKSLELTKW